MAKIHYSYPECIGLLNRWMNSLMRILLYVYDYRYFHALGFLKFNMFVDGTILKKRLKVLMSNFIHLGLELLMKSFEFSNCKPQS